MKKHCEVRLVDIASYHNMTVRSKNESLQQKQIVPKQTSRSLKPKSNHILEPKYSSTLKQGNTFEENKQSNNLKRKVILDTMNLLLDQRPLKQKTTNKKEVKTSKNCNKRKKIRHKTFWESKLTGAKRVSKRLSKLKRDNKTFEIMHNSNNRGLLKNINDHSIKSLKKIKLRKNEQVNKRVESRETKTNKLKIPIGDNNLNISKELFPKICSKPYNRNEHTNIKTKTFLETSGSSHIHDKETVPVTSTVASKSGSWNVKENKNFNAHEREFLITTYSEAKKVNEEIGDLDLYNLQESVIVNNTVGSDAATEDSECVVANISTTFNEDDMVIEVEDVKQYINSNEIITDVEASENEVQDTSIKSECSKNEDLNQMGQNEQCKEYLTDNSTSGNVLPDLRDTLELVVTSNKNKTETQLPVDKIDTATGKFIANDDTINTESVLTSQSEKMEENTVTTHG